MRAGGVTVGLIVLVRLVMIFNPLGIRFEVFNNPESYAAIAAEAGRPSGGFRYGYAVAAKSCVLYGRRGLLPAQYPLPYASVAVPRRRFAVHRSRSARRMPDGTVSGQHPAGADPHDGQRPGFTWFVDPAFHPVRLVDIAFTGLPGGGWPRARRCASNCASRIPILCDPRGYGRHSW